MHKKVDDLKTTHFHNIQYVMLGKTWVLYRGYYSNAAVAKWRYKFTQPWKGHSCDESRLTHQ